MHHPVSCLSGSDTHFGKVMLENIPIVISRFKSVSGGQVEGYIALRIRNSGRFAMKMRAAGPSSEGGVDNR